MNTLPDTVLRDLVQQASELADQYVHAQGVLPPRKAAEHLSLAIAGALEAAYLRGTKDARREETRETPTFRGSILPYSGVYLFS